MAASRQDRPGRAVLGVGGYRLAVGALAVGALATVWLSDPVAAAVAVVGVAATGFALRRRSSRRVRLAGSGLVAGVTLVGVIAALAVPAYRDRPGALVVNEARSPTGAEAHPVSPVRDGAALDVMGLVATDYDDSGAGVDRDVSRLSTLAATGIALASDPGSIEIQQATDSLARAHLNGASGLAVVSNYDGSDFNGDRARRMIESPDAERRFVSAVTGEVARRGWDGVVLDFERLPAVVRNLYPRLVEALSEALGNRRVVVAVPATTSRDDPDLRAYDVRALGRWADQVLWMAYDQHEPGGDPGPVAGLPWVEATLKVAEAAVAPHKLLLGIAGYGYAWTGSGHGTELTVAAAQALASQPGATSRWDITEQERHVRLADGRDVWYEDARADARRADLAAAHGLGGVGLWRVGSEDTMTLSSLPVRVAKHAPLPIGRTVERVEAVGLAALTFDDGPDPRWTPRILDVLRREHVPATFFVIGTSAQAHPSLVRAEARNGHVVANHTYSHHNLARASPLRARVEILGGEAVLEGILGRKPYLFRSPYGAGDSRTGGLGADQLATDLGLHPVNWTDDPNDWRSPGVRTIVQRALAGATERTVVLLHDGGGNRAETVAALPKIIDGLRSRGLLFTTVDALDASIPAPYVARADRWSQARGVLIVGVFRLEMAFRRVILWALLAVAVVSLVRFAVCVPLAIRQARRARRVIEPRDVPPLTVSIVIPAHNEERVITKTLHALERLRGRPAEIVVVDDGSTDATAAAARRAGAVVIEQSKSSKANAINTGLGAVSGEVVVVLDADTVLAPDFVSAVVPHFADPAVAAVAGNVKVGNRGSLLARLQAVEYLVSLNLDRRAQATLNVIGVVPGAAGAFRRSALAAVGGYRDETLVEDADLTVSLLRAGYRIPYESHAVAWTEAPEHLTDALKQRRRWSYGTVQVAAKHRAILLDPHAGAVGLVGLPWTLVSQVLIPLGGPLADLFFAYLAAIGRVSAAGIVLGLAIAADVVLTIGAVIAEREDPLLIVTAPLLRLVWRPMQLIALVSSMRSWTRGSEERWNKVRRHNSVELAAELTR